MCPVLGVTDCPPVIFLKSVFLHNVPLGAFYPESTPEKMLNATSGEALLRRCRTWNNPVWLWRRLTCAVAALQSNDIGSERCVPWQGPLSEMWKEYSHLVSDSDIRYGDARQLKKDVSSMKGLNVNQIFASLLTDAPVFTPGNGRYHEALDLCALF